MSEQVLAGDVGGTNARLAVVQVDEGRARILARHTAEVRGHDGLIEPLRAFLESLEAPPTRACLAVAGKLQGRRVEGVNSTWVVDADAIARGTSLEHVRLVNDFYAAAAGVALLREGDLHALGDGVPRRDAPIAVLGAGTGLGQAFSLPTSGRRRVVGSEGGHRDFGPRTPLQDRLLAHLREAHGRVSTERVLSGPGLVTIYRFLVDAEGLPPSDAVEAKAESDRAPAISDLALRGAHTTCVEALGVFVDVYGAEAGNVALTALAQGGVYLAGGIAPKVLTLPGPGAAFRRAFEDKGRFRQWLSEVPVYVVLNEDLGLLGAAAEATE